MARLLQLAQYNAGTIGIALVSGVWQVTGVGTNFLSPDGVTNWNLAPGDMLVCGGAFGLIGSVTDATHASLAVWTGSAVSAGSTYTIFRITPAAQPAFQGLLQYLTTLWTDANPGPYETIDTGNVRFKLDDDGSGNLRLRVRSSGAAGGDSAYVTAFTINATTGLMTVADLANTAGLAMAAAPWQPTNRNLLINGDMLIDQRNAGASGTAINVYTVDRWQFSAPATGKFTWGQNLNGVAPPAGFATYLGFQSSSAYSLAISDSFFLSQPIEANDTRAIGFGSASAATLSLSFWVFASQTGAYSGSLRNYALSRSYPFTFSVSSANTWTQVSLSIPADTGGTWTAFGAAGSAVLAFDLGSGPTYRATSGGSWQSGNFVGVSGAMNVVANNAATFYATGVQLEANASATPYETLAYTTQLERCQRFYRVGQGTLFTPAANVGNFGGALISYTLDPPMRAAPTVTTNIFNSDTHWLGTLLVGGDNTSVSFHAGTTQTYAGAWAMYTYTASAEL